jgi:transcriptional regulator of arginine metabolism
MNKQQRQETIIRIIKSGKINSQQMLIEEMAKAGYKITQATLSRDLKFLRVAKQSQDDGTYLYTIVDDTPLPKARNIPNIAGNAFLKVEFSGNMAVAKTLPGFAPGLASTIDSLSPNCFLGSVAGDDTIFLVIREGVSRKELRAELLEKFPELGIKIHI